MNISRKVGIEMAKLTEEAKAAIENYSNEIYSAKDSLDGIRHAWPMYIGSGGKNGFLVLVREIFDNSVDQMLDKKFPCNHVLVQFDERTNRCTITDNGKGLPYKDMVRIFTKAHTSKNYTKEEGSGNYSIGVNGVGAKAVAALSSEFIAESYMYDGTAKQIVFHEGIQDTKDPVDIPNKDKFQGTKISFIPSDIIGEVNAKYPEVYNLVRNIFALLPTDKIMDFEAIDTNGKVHTEHVVNTDGIMYFLVKQVSNPIVTPIEGFADDGNSKLRIMFTWDAAALNDPAAKESELTALMSEYDPQVNRSTDNGYEWLDDDGYSISVRDGDGKVMYVDYNEGKFTLDYRNWKTDYDLCRMDYEDLLRDINNLLNSKIVFIVVRSNGEVLSLWTASDSECSRDEMISVVRRLQSEHQTIDEKTAEYGYQIEGKCFDKTKGFVYTVEPEG